MTHAIGFVVAAVLAAGATAATPGATRTPASGLLSPTPVIDWSLEAQRAIVPPPAGVGNKFPGDAAVYMGLVHIAMYDAALAIQGGFRPYAIALTAPKPASPAAAIAAAAHGVLVGLLPAQQADLDIRYADYRAGLPDDTATANGIAIGQRVAAAVLALREGDGRENNPVYEQPTPGPGVFQPDPSRPVLGLRLSQVRPLALVTPWQFRPDGPSPLTSDEYAQDFGQVKAFGSLESAARTDDQTTQALFWTDHDLRQWNEALHRLSAIDAHNLVETARMLALAHVSGGDAMIACFDAKYHYMFWRPATAIPLAQNDGNGGTTADPTWRPLRPTPNFPEYPSAHACHTSAIAEALTAFFGTDKVSFWIDSRVTGTVRQYDRFRTVVKDVDAARVLAGFHFRNSDQEGANLGRKVARFVVDHLFQPE
jgi:hypothetical protein